MDDEQHVWDRQPDEPILWYRRFERFRLMQPVRSVATVFTEENSKKLEKTRKTTAPDGTWYAIAKKWQWEERAVAWDDYIDEQIEQQIAAEKKRILRSEYALMHKRVELLSRKIQQLEVITESQDGIWIPDVKSVGTGPNAERVDLVQFNADVFRELREYLTDIAEEMGERVKTTKQEVTGKDGGPIQTVLCLPDNGDDDVEQPQVHEEPPLLVEEAS